MKKMLIENNFDHEWKVEKLSIEEDIKGIFGLFRMKKINPPEFWSSFMFKLFEEMHNEYYFMADVTPLYSVKPKHSFTEEQEYIEKFEENTKFYASIPETSNNKIIRFVLELRNIEDITDFVYWYYDDHSLSMYLVDKKKFIENEFKNFMENVSYDIDLPKLFASGVGLLINFEFAGRSVNLTYLKGKNIEEVIDRALSPRP